jgi:hypothetical protein
MQTHLHRALIACNFITGFPEDVEQPNDFTPVLPYFVVPAALVALVSLIVFGISLATLAKIPAALLGSLVITALWAMVSRGQNLSAFTDLVVVLRSQLDLRRAGSLPQETLQQIALLAALLLKVAFLAVLVYYKQWHAFIVVPLCTVLFSMEMSIHLGYFSRSHELFASCRFLALLAFFLVACLAGFPGLFTLGFIWLLCFFLGAWASSRFPERRQELINGGAEGAELLALLFCVVFIH